jgi:DNA polymerase-4
LITNTMHDQSSQMPVHDMPAYRLGTDGMGVVQPVRKIIHVDMDAFYASVEQRDNPELRGLPLAVGGSAARGVVAAASYEARVFGVHSAMPSVTATRKCPDLIFVPPRFEVYRQVSQQIREIFAEYTPLIEPLSLDEAYLDVTENLKGMEIATEIALEIRAKIKAVTGLNASAGISYVPGQDGERPEQAERPGCHHPEERPEFRRSPPRQEIPWRGAGDGRADETAWDRNGA